MGKKIIARHGKRCSIIERVNDTIDSIRWLWVKMKEKGKCESCCTSSCCWWQSIMLIINNKKNVVTTNTVKELIVSMMINWEWVKDLKRKNQKKKNLHHTIHRLKNEQRLTNKYIWNKQNKMWQQVNGWMCGVCVLSIFIIFESLSNGDPLRNMKPEMKQLFVPNTQWNIEHTCI